MTLFGALFSGAKVVAKSYPGQPGSMFVLKNGQPELMDSAMLSYRETMKHDEGEPATFMLPASFGQSPRHRSHRRQQPD